MQDFGERGRFGRVLRENAFRAAAEGIVLVARGAIEGVDLGDLGPQFVVGVRSSE
jgi:hypothetical protein